LDRNRAEWSRSGKKGVSSETNGIQGNRLIPKTIRKASYGARVHRERGLENRKKKEENRERKKELTSRGKTP